MLLLHMQIRRYFNKICDKCIYICIIKYKIYIHMAFISTAFIHSTYRVCVVVINANGRHTRYWLLFLITTSIYVMHCSQEKKCIRRKKHLRNCEFRNLLEMTFRYLLLKLLHVYIISIFVRRLICTAGAREPVVCTYISEIYNIHACQFWYQLTRGKIKM
jgi:hypothetical protein